MASEAVVASEDGEDLDPGSLPDPEESGVDKRGPRAPQLTRLGRYRLVREIASGGMASVNLAVTEGLDKLVALKMIHPHLAQEEAFVHMFLDEARIASSISHRNVCNTFDFGEAEGRYYIAMDYLAGHTLRDLIHRLRRFASDGEPKRLSAFMAYVLAEACEGLHAAHELRNPDGELLEVVHRDVSPHNLFVTYEGNVSVVDFGIARAADRLQHTATGVLKGKFSYMAPEQVRQLKVDRRADIWSLGVCLWESLTLERLFVRSSQADTLMSVMMDKIRPPSEVRPGLHPGLDAIVMKALSRNPAHRYATAREMGRDLMQVVRDSSMVVGAVEIEQWLERLFGREREEARKLTRKAKQAALESSWSEGTPSGLPRVPTRSGMLPKVPAMHAEPAPRASTPSAQVSLVRADEADARATESPRLNKGRMALAALAGLAIAMVTTWGLDLVTRVPPPSAPAAAPRRLEIATPATVVVAPAPEIAAPPEPVPAAAPVAEPRPVAAERLAAWRGPARVPAAKPKIALAATPTIAAQPAAEAPAPVSVAEIAPVAPAPAPAPAPPEPSGSAAAAPAPRSAPAPVAPAPSPKRLEAVATFGSLEVSGSLGPGAVARMMGRATPLVHTCYADAAQRAGRNDFSPLAVSFSIDEMGALRGVESGAHPLPGLSRCIGDSLKRIRSDNKPDIGTVRVRLQVTFRQR